LIHRDALAGIPEWLGIDSIAAAGAKPPDWGLRVAQGRFSTPALAVVGAAALLLVVLPFCEEVLRCLRKAPAAATARTRRR
jgi:hypothetical protein